MDAFLVLAQSAQELNWAQTGILGVVVLAIVWSGLKRAWMFTWAHEEITRALREDLERERIETREWRTLALTQAGLMERQVEKTTEIVREIVSDGR